MMSGSSWVPSTWLWLARICSTNVEPERGRPTMKIGSGADDPCPARAAKNWAESDRLRDAIAAAGWLVKDSREGQSVTKK